MALTALLHDLSRLHHWPLSLWHGDHGWRPESAAQARQLATWAQQRSLAFDLERADPAPAGEAAARQWRYDCLQRLAAVRGCRHVVTAHTGSDRAETLLLNLARGSHHRGLASLPALRPLAAPALLVRPLLPFSRQDTARICRELALPIWEDGTNLDARFGRNRIRAEVMPVLEQLHPGAGRRIGALAQRLEEELHDQDELVALALQSLRPPQDPGGRVLLRPGLAQLSRANRRRLLQHWLVAQGAPALTGPNLEDLAARLDRQWGPGQQNLAGGWLLRWDRSTLVLQCPAAPDPGHG